MLFHVTKPLLVTSICLAVVSFAHGLVHGQGDFETPDAQPIEPLPTFFDSESADPIASIFLQNDAPVSQSTLYQDLYSVPTSEYAAPAADFNSGVPQQDIVYSDEVEYVSEPELSGNDPTWADAERFPRRLKRRRGRLWTASFFGGPSFVNNAENEHGAAARHAEQGGAIGIAIGKYWERTDWRVRSELEYSWRANEIESREMLISRTFFDVAGSVKRSTAMVNFYFEGNAPPEHRLTSYIGLGLGSTNTQITDTLNGRDFAAGDGTAFAVQGMIGVNYEIFPDRAHFFTELRGLRTSDTDIDMLRVGSSRPNSLGVSEDVGGFTFDLLFGLRFQL